MTYFVLQTLLLLLIFFLLGALVGCGLRKWLAPLSPGPGEGYGDGLAAAGASAGASGSLRKSAVSDNAREAQVTLVPRATVSSQALERETDEQKELPPAAPPSADDLTRIKGVGVNLAKRLNQMGVTRFSQIAAWEAADIAQISQALGFSGRIEREEWVRQAALLAEGREVTFTRAGYVWAGEPNPDETTGALAGETETGMTEGVQDIGGEADSEADATVSSEATAGTVRDTETSQVTETEERTETQSVSNAGETGKAAALAGAMAAAVAIADREDAAEVATAAEAEELSGETVGATTRAVAGEAASQADNLTRIRGIGPVMAKRLNALGITRYDQIANWTADDIAKLNAALGFSGRIEREDWVGQARVLAKGEVTAFARLVDGEALSSFRNFATELPVTGGEAGEDGPEAPDPGPPDDLKRIKGIGAVIEKKLNALGITRFSQIAEWGPEDIAKINEILAFSGRIEREQWISQAQILAAGGETEFSRRQAKAKTTSAQPASRPKS